MNIETMKSVILVILIAFSLVLTVALWNYQPVNDTLEDDVLIGNTQLDELGSERTLSELFIPEEIVFHDGNAYYAHADSIDKKDFYQQQMQQWNVTNIDASPGSINLDNNHHAVEIVFPAEIPVQTIQDLFALNNEEGLEGIQASFDRIFVVQQNGGSLSSTFSLWFVDSDSSENRFSLKADISTSAGENAFRELDNKEELKELIRVRDTIANEEGTKDGFANIYLPKQTSMVPEYVLQTDSLDVKPIQNDLFPSNTAVTSYTSSGGERVTKTFKQQLTQFDKRMEYELTIPNAANQNDLQVYDMLLQSMQDINSHLGWTNDYRLSSIVTGWNQVQYQMYFGGLPVMENSETSMLATILMRYQQGQIQEYKRPLVKFSSITSERKATLKSGEQVLEDLQEKSDLDNRTILDLKIMYTLQEQRNNLVYSLIPEWYIKTNAGWMKVYSEGQSQNEEIS